MAKRTRSRGQSGSEAPCVNALNDAVAAAPLALAARALADAELVDEYGISPLEDLDVADARVGDVRVHARGAVPGRACARSASDCLQESNDEYMRS